MGKRSVIHKDNWKVKRELMVRTIKQFGIIDKNVIRAMEKVKRHIYIPAKYRGLCNPYGNHPCPIGYGQTISQPYMVAYMTERLGLKRGDKVLEIGTGSGYQAAILAEIGCEVISMEIIKELAVHSRLILKKEGYNNVQIIHGSGYIGYPEKAPYDAVIVTCAPKKIPGSLLKELKEGGKMIIPVGVWRQKLLCIEKKGGEYYTSEEMDVRFVPMVKKK
ncbi:MAG: protein-L-isoaspartate(D-aspartate) O-methyltransferase [Acidobacteriota bacterium]